MTHAAHRTFRRFVVDGTNARAVAVLRRRARCGNADRAALLISGPSGVGKSHLLHATAGTLRAGTRVAMITAEAWMHVYGASIRRGEAPAFSAAMAAACDALLVDGLEDLADKPVTLAALGAIARQVTDHGGLVVLACGAASTPAILEVLGEVMALRIVEVRASCSTFGHPARPANRSTSEMTTSL